jgi:hypothetical protein
MNTVPLVCAEIGTKARDELSDEIGLTPFPPDARTETKRLELSGGEPIERADELDALLDLANLDPSVARLLISCPVEPALCLLVEELEEPNKGLDVDRGLEPLERGLSHLRRFDLLIRLVAHFVAHRYRASPLG